VIRPNFQKIITLDMTSDEDNFYIIIVDINEIYNFLVLSFFI